jgi:hypothetical protein
MPTHMTLENLLETNFQNYSVKSPVGTINPILLSSTKKFTGDIAWDRFLKIKSDVLNNIIPIWKSLVTNNDCLPSGKQLQDVLSQVLVQYNIECQQKKKRTKEAVRLTAEEVVAAEEENEVGDVGDIEVVNNVNKADATVETTNDGKTVALETAKYPLTWLVFVKHASPAGKLQDQIWATEQDIQDVVNGKRKSITKESKKALKVRSVENHLIIVVIVIL